MPKPFEPIELTINSGHIDANTSQPCPALESTKAVDAKLWKMIQTLFAEDFIILPCHNTTGINWPDGKKVK